MLTGHLFIQATGDLSRPPVVGLANKKATQTVQFGWLASCLEPAIAIHGVIKKPLISAKLRKALCQALLLGTNKRFSFS